MYSENTVAHHIPLIPKYIGNIMIAGRINIMVLPRDKKPAIFGCSVAKKYIVKTIDIPRIKIAKLCISRPTVVVAIKFVSFGLKIFIKRFGNFKIVKNEQIPSIALTNTAFFNISKTLLNFLAP